MAAKRYREYGIGSVLGVLLGFSSLKQYGPIRLPGVKRLAGLALTCPDDDDELIDNGDGTASCQHCGKSYKILDGN